MTWFETIKICDDLWIAKGLWTARGLCNFVREPAKKAHEVCSTVVGDLRRGKGSSAWNGFFGVEWVLRRGMGTIWRGMGYNLQVNSKTQKGSRHIDRDAQFQSIKTQAVAQLSHHRPADCRGDDRHWPQVRAQSGP
jgi:Rhodopirellula transposase DDE domain